jgi:PAS domain S-box-containing protein
MSKILICEDEPIIALDIQRTLIRLGHGVVGSYSNAEEAIQACEVLKPGLVLMDIELKGPMDGLDASKWIYEHYSIPVILITAFADEVTVNRAKDSSPFGYIIKPFEERELRTSIEIALYRHEMDQKLRFSEERYRSLFEEAPTANFTATTSGNITDCNGTFLSLFAFPEREKAVGFPFVDLFNQQKDGETVLEKNLRNTVTGQEEWSLRKRNGEALFVLATLIVRGGELRGYLVDVTEWRELEAQFRQSQKMEAMGRLAGGVAHDFNNIITAIMGYCNLLSEDVGDNPLIKEEVEGILSASRRAVNLTKQLLAFSRKQAVEPRILDVNDFLRDLEKMIRRLVSENIDVKFYLEAKRATISIDPGQFEQIIINLVVNAKDAIEGSGSIILETANVRCDGQGPYHGLKKGEWVMVLVRDSGSGIAKEDLQRVFEPFFSTKPKDKGTGLGLSTVYTVVNRAGGQVDVESEVGKGSRFFIYFPLVSNVKAEVPLSTEGPMGTARSGTVLLVEDDDYLRGLLARLLGKTGYRVLEAANPGEALLLAEREQDFMLISDIVLPHMDGYELANRMAVSHPNLKILFMSGYHDKNEDPGKKNYGKSRFIRKPFSHEELLAILDTL